MEHVSTIVFLNVCLQTDNFRRSKLIEKDGLTGVMTLWYIIRCASIAIQELYINLYEKR